ncbi:MAG: phosphohydrolase [Microbacteriaceae bacterium]
MNAQHETDNHLSLHEALQELSVDDAAIASQSDLSTELLRLDEFDMKLALKIATFAHHGQFDKSGADYIHHPMRVAETIEGFPRKIVAILHDTVEDYSEPQFMQTMLEVLFPAEIVAAVLAISRVPNESSEAYYARVKANPLALSVKIADLLDNSDPQRLEKLDLQTRTRLEEKYASALKSIMKSE